MPKTNQRFVEGTIERRPVQVSDREVQRVERGLALAAIAQSLPWFMWAAPLLVFFGFLILALWFQHNNLSAFVSGVLLWAMRLLMVAGVVLAVVVARKCFKLYHDFILDVHARRASKANVDKAVAGARNAELKNEQLAVKIALERQLPDVLKWAVAHGYPVKYGKEGLELLPQLLAPAGPVGELGAGAPAGLLAAPEYPSMEWLMQSVERNCFLVPIGMNVETRQPIVVSLIDNHIKVIGTSGKGKSSWIGSLLEMLMRLHEPERLWVVIFDHEDKTGRLFLGREHVRQHVRGDKVLIAEHILALRAFMEKRYQAAAKYGERWLKTQAHVVVYFEEFLDWRKHLPLLVEKQFYARVMQAFESLATRARKANIHLLLAVQTDYEDKDLKTALAQIAGVKVAFWCTTLAVAQSAGFLETELIKALLRANQKGRFVVEKDAENGGPETGIAANFDARALVEALPGDVSEEMLGDISDAVIALDVSGKSMQGQEAEERGSERAGAPPANVRVFPRPGQEKPVATLLDAKRAWNDGAQGPRPLQRALNEAGFVCTYYQAGQFIKDIEEELRQQEAQ